MFRVVLVVPCPSCLIPARMVRVALCGCGWGVGVGVGVGVRVWIGAHTLESLRLQYPLIYVLYAMYIYTTHTYPLTYVRIHTCMHTYIVGHAHVNTYTQWHP